MAVGIGSVGIGIGAVAIPLALIGGGVLAAILLADDVAKVIDKLQELPEAILGDPNNLGGEKAEKTLKAGLDEVLDDTGETPYISYRNAATWRKTARSEAFQAIHGVGSQDDPELAQEWLKFAQENPLPPQLALESGVGVGGGAAGGGCVYQVSIRITAARRAISAKGNLLTNPLGEVASWMGKAAGGSDYYTKPEDASGFVSDPLLDLLAVRFPSDFTTPWKSSGTSTWAGSKLGLEIEEAMNSQIQNA